MGGILRDVFLVAGGAALLIFQVYRPIVWSMVFGFFLLGLVSFSVSLLAARRPFLLGMLPAILLMLATYGRDFFVGRLSLIPENIGILLVQVTIILLMSVVAAMAGTLVRRSLRW